MSIGRGTTDAIRYVLDQDISSFPAVWLSIKDRKGNLINLDKERLAFKTEEDGFYVIGRLTQKETLRLAEGELKVQLRARDINGEAYKTIISSTMADRILMDGEI